MSKQKFTRQDISLSDAMSIVKRAKKQHFMLFRISDIWRGKLSPFTGLFVVLLSCPLITTFVTGLLPRIANANEWV